MLREIEKSVILKQEYDKINGKYYILVKTDMATIAFYGSYGLRNSMRFKVFPLNAFTRQKEKKLKTYTEDYSRSINTYIPKSHQYSFENIIKDNSKARLTEIEREKIRLKESLAINEKIKEAKEKEKKEKSLKDKKKQELEKINKRLEGYGGISM